MISCLQRSLSCLFLLILSAGVAQAEVRHHRFDHDARWTLIWCAVIIAGGMIAAALILRGRK